jgi:hypothetical protein
MEKIENFHQFGWVLECRTMWDEDDKGCMIVRSVMRSSITFTQFLNLIQGKVLGGSRRDREVRESEGSV